MGNGSAQPSQRNRRVGQYAQLKNRTGLQMLSSVFAAALEKRQSHNTIHAPGPVGSCRGSHGEWFGSAFAAEQTGWPDLEATPRANEIRAFKRKGTSGALAVGLEAKWVREWTTNVQQLNKRAVNPTLEINVSMLLTTDGYPQARTHMSSSPSNWTMTISLNGSCHLSRLLLSARYQSGF
jgi:hypothetical protein